MQWYFDALAKYAVFTGRAQRREFWMYLLVLPGMLVAASVVDLLVGTFNADSGYGLVGALLVLGSVIPTLAVGARRLHDTDRSAWWLLAALVPLGVVVLIFMWLDDGDRGDNRFGPDPLSRAQVAQGAPVRVGGGF